MPGTYRTVSVPSGHPLCTPKGTYVYEHRLVLWNKIGPGEHRCHHGCGRVVAWKPGAGARRGSLVVDHLDDNPHNNEPSNLVPSCNPCNQGRKIRKRAIRDDETFVVCSTTGVRKRAVPLICGECGGRFAAPARRDGKLQKFCSRSCAGRSSRRAVIQNRGVQNKASIQEGELWVSIGKSGRTRADQKRCAECSVEYLVVKSQAAKSKFCGKTCRLKSLHRRKIKNMPVDEPACMAG